MNYGFVKVAAAVPKLKVANCDYNRNEIVNLIIDADKKGCQIIVFPELSITSYTCGDLFQHTTLINSALKSLNYIMSKVSDIDIISIIGLPIRYKNGLYNCAAVIQGNQLLGIVPKTYIPCQKEFYEDRWFVSGSEIKNESIKLFNKNIPFGVDLLFCDHKHKEICFGIEICEDLWMPISPSSYQAINSATILFNLSASNEIIGKYEYRKELVKQQSGKCLAAYIYTSSGPSESTTDIVFSGHSLIAENGSILCESERFKRKSHYIMTEIDVQKLIYERNNMTSFAGINSDCKFRNVEFKVKKTKIELLSRKIDQHPFVPRDDLNRDKRCEEIFNIQTAALAKRIEHTNLKKAVIGISGGLDSTLALLVIVRAFDLLAIPRENIIAITMPGFGTSSNTRENAINLIEQIGSTLKEIDITKVCKVHMEDIGHEENVHDITYENVQARERTQILMDIANKLNGLVIGTGDLSELALGWCTYNGDHMSMYAVNSGIPKTLVKYLVQWAADNVFEKKTTDVLNKIIFTPISPELLPPTDDGDIHQKTEEIIGPYELHDFFIYYFLRFGFSPKKIVYLTQHAFVDKYSTREIKKWLKVFLSRFFSQQFKRSCLPDGPKVGTVSLSPRGDWRMPSDADSSIWINEF